MKKYVLLGVLALALLAIPVAVAADSPPYSVVQGTIEKSIAVYSSANLITLDMSHAGYTPYQSTTVSYKTTGPINTWAVVADDNKGNLDPNYGKMVNSVPEPLFNWFEISWDGLWPTYWTLQPGRTIASGNGEVDSSIGVYFQQMILVTDPTGQFGIQVNFNGQVT